MKSDFNGWPCRFGNMEAKLPWFVLNRSTPFPQPTDRPFIGSPDSRLPGTPARSPNPFVTGPSSPESFQLEKNGPRVYVNSPKSRKIAVVDRDKHAIVATWNTGLSLANYPMALNEPDHRLFVVTRLPARLLVLDTGSGNVVQTLSAVGDCDDVFFDSARKRIYAIGGEGAISIFAQDDPNHYRDVGRVPTVKGARMGFFAPEIDRLFVAVRRQGSTPAAIQVFDPGR
jgi:hypothetical protein